ncbi:acyl-CoA dehydrogenase family protein [Defluviimonas aestuarii]|uniref:acyl-CoA dehydrogenase family protein n=1 Tax=Albidovulum aestuarii TaxID=1130726 RepID=UPI00249B7BF9|nr:acyl-CoA dehydrogenase family protein [Defluviimonas aestuarii]MDI3334935.1 acyl-CoA dehydrogenase family protein [Defluviimonas aestuarii]
MLDQHSASTAATMIERFERIRPLLTAQCGRLDADRRLSDEVFGALSDAGFFRLLLPAQLGGCGLSPLDFMTVVEHAAALDGTIGWLVGNGGGMSRAGGYLPPEAAQEVFGNPSAFVASSTGATGEAVPAKSGFRITGRWPYASGAPHATTFAAVCEVDEGKGPGNGRAVLAFLPREALKLIDNWHVSGMRGTGSWDFEADSVFLPAEFVCDLPPIPTQPGIVYRLPSISAFVWTVATVPLGIAQGAINALISVSNGHRRLGITVPIAERELIQAEIGRCLAKCRSAGAYMRSAMSALCASVEGDGPDQVETRINYRLACSHAAEVAVSVVLKVNDLIGARALAESQPFERRERDVRAAAKHIAMSAEQFVIGGRYALGGDISSARF